jgi:hypothetical protein
MTTRFPAGVLLATLLLLVPGKQAMAGDADIDITALGPQVGDAAPGFTLPDQAGLEHTLKSLMGPRGLVLVFFRSADW